MSDTPKTRRVAIEKWTCPNHPDGPPKLPADGYEREELTLGEAFSEEQVSALRQVVDSARRAQLRGPADVVERMFGLCCLGHTWKTVGYEDVEVGPFQAYLEEMQGPMAAAMRASLDGSILLAELTRKRDDVLGVRIPIIVSPEPPA